MAHFITVPMRWRTFCAVACLQVQMGSSTAITSAVVIRSTPFRPRRGQAYSRSVACQLLALRPPAFHVAPWIASTLATASSKVGVPGGATGGWARVAPRAGDPAVGEGAFARLGQWHEGEASEAERAALAVDDESLHPVAGAGTVRRAGRVRCHRSICPAGRRCDRKRPRAPCGDGDAWAWSFGGGRRELPYDIPCTILVGIGVAVSGRRWTERRQPGRIPDFPERCSV